MLSISARGSAAGAEKYYDHLNDEHQAKGRPEDYYSNSRDQPGQWVGAGAVALGLTGAVSREDFGHALRGRSPDGRDLVQGAGDSHRAGWDLTFSAPKSVSIAWAMGDEQQRQAIQMAHDAAVRAALAHVQEHALVARRGKGGAERESAQMVASIFAHGTSREQDPQLHSHAFVHNLAQRADGSWGAIESRDLYQWKMASGAIYRAELASQMQQLGFEVEKDRDAFRLAAVPRQAEQEFSTRRQQIEAALAEHGTSGAKASEVAALDSRRAKTHVDQAALIQDWQRRGREVGFGPEQAAAARQAEPMQGEPPARADLLRALTENQSTFQERDIYRVAATLAQGSGMDAAGVRDTVRDLTQDRELVRLTHRESGEIRWTTREMQQIERGMLETSMRLDARQGHTLDSASVDTALARFEREKGFALSDEQGAAVRHICQGNALSMVQGGAGTGKSTMAEAARLAWEGAGFTVRGAAISGKAAAGLEDGSGIQSQTVASLLQGIQSGRDVLDSKTVLVIDEAGMLGSRQTAQLLEAAERASAKVVLIGDSRQLQAVDAGGAFRALQQQHGAAFLDEIRRQKTEDMKAAVEHLSKGEVREAMKLFLDRDMIHVKDDKQAAMQEAVNQWAEKYDRANPGECIVMANTRAEVANLNALAREWMKQNHQLGPSAEIQTTNREGNPAGRMEFAEGDRIKFGLNSRIGVKNGELGTLQRIETDRRGETWLTVRMDRGETVRFSPDTRDERRQYACIQHGYAITTHAAQGVTADHAVVLAGGSMQSMESTYVQMSRMRYSTQIVTTRQAVADQAAANGIDLSLDEDRDPLDDLRDLVEQMETSRQKDTTLDYEADEPEQGGPVIVENHRAPEAPSVNFLDLAQKMAWAESAAEFSNALAGLMSAPSWGSAPAPEEQQGGQAQPAPVPVLDSGPELD